MDNKEENGGFIIVPGMHKYMHDWSKMTESTLLNEFGKNNNYI